MMFRSLLLAVSIVGVAQADEVDPKQATSSGYLELARKMTADGKHAEACPLYENAFKAVASDGTLDELTKCYRALTSQLLAAKQDSSTVCRAVISDASVSPSKDSRKAVAACHSARSDALIDAKDFKSACEAAEAAVTAVDSKTNLAFAAGCYRDAGKLGRAWRRLLDAKAKAATPTESNIDQLIVEMISAVRPGRVIVTIPVDAKVEIDGEAITKQGISLAGGEPEKDSENTIGYPLDAGSHVVKVTAAGKPPVEKSITIVDGNLEPVTIELPGDVVTTPPGGGDNTRSRQSPRKKIGWITIAASGAVGLVGLYFGYDALGKQNDADEACPTAMNCSGEAIALNNDAGRAANISNVLVGVGLVGAAVGTVLVLTAPKNERSATQTRVVPTAGPGGVGLVFSGGF